MISLQRFKDHDETEAKVIQVVMPTLLELGEDHDDFYDGATTAFGFGDVLYDLGRDPLSGVLTRDVYRRSFPAIHQLFTRPGTFEFYLTVFRSIWGDDVEITFNIPSPGVLEINATVLELENFTLVFRRIEGDDYVYDKAVTQADERILVRDTVGVKTQEQIDALLQEISVEGIFTTMNLTL